VPIEEEEEEVWLSLRILITTFSVDLPNCVYITLTVRGEVRHPPDGAHVFNLSVMILG
jgi:hypothetical protein